MKHLHNGDLQGVVLEHSKEGHKAAEDEAISKKSRNDSKHAWFGPHHQTHQNESKIYQLHANTLDLMVA